MSGRATVSSTDWPRVVPVSSKLASNVTAPTSPGEVGRIDVVEDDRVPRIVARCDEGEKQIAERDAVEGVLVLREDRRQQLLERELAEFVGGRAGRRT